MKIFKLLILSLVWPAFMEAQSNSPDETSFILSEDSEIRINGTSSMHDWSMEATAYYGSMSGALLDGKAHLTHLMVEVEVGGLISGKSGMEKDARKTLNAESFPLIRFEQSSPLELPTLGATLRETSIVLEGTLQIRDQSQAVQIEARISISENTIQLNGLHILNMTDYGVEPPRALLGLIKTGEEVTIDFQTLWKRSY